MPSGRCVVRADPDHLNERAEQYLGATAPDAYRYGSEDAASGWVTFAGVMLVILATVNVIDGIAAVSNSTFFTANAKFVISGLNTWGWILILCGTGQGLVAVPVHARGGRARARDRTHVVVDAQRSPLEVPP